MGLLTSSEKCLETAMRRSSFVARGLTPGMSCTLTYFFKLDTCASWLWFLMKSSLQWASSSIHASSFSTRRQDAYLQLGQICAIKGIWALHIKYAIIHPSRYTPDLLSVLESCSAEKKAIKNLPVYICSAYCKLPLSKFQIHSADFAAGGTWLSRKQREETESYKRAAVFTARRQRFCWLGGIHRCCRHKDQRPWTLYSLLVANTASFPKANFVSTAKQDFIHCINNDKICVV